MGPRFQHRGLPDPDAARPHPGQVRPTLSGTLRLIDFPTATAASRTRTGHLTRLWRRVRLAAHLLRGVATVLLRYPFSAQPIRLAMRRRWSADMLAILGVELRAEGEALAPGCMVVANHISWLDIFVINALAPTAFVAKAEVRAWPCIGWLAARNDTIFLRRGSRGHARIINREVAAVLDDGRNVAIFPEGTTTDGTHVQHFHAALLQPAIESGHPVQAVAIRYRMPDGEYCRAPVYDGDVSLLQCLAAILAEPRIIAHAQIMTPSRPAEGSGRRELARGARDAIAEAIAQ